MLISKETDTLLEKYRGKWESGNYSEALDALFRLVDLGETVAYGYIGALYEYGQKGVPQDVDKALQFYLLACEHKWTHGYVGLGRMYYLANGVVRDFDRAHKFFSALEYGGLTNSVADYFLGQMYIRGVGVEKDPKRALFYFERSFDQGSLYSGIRIAEIHFDAGRVFQSIKQRFKVILTGFNNIYRNKGPWDSSDPRFSSGWISQRLNVVSSPSDEPSAGDCQ